MPCLKFDFKNFLKNYPKELIQQKLVVLFSVSSDNIFPITDLPRGLGLNFFSLVYNALCFELKDGEIMPAKRREMKHVIEHDVTLLTMFDLE